MSIKHIFFPSHCAFCGCVTNEESGICVNCAGKLPFIEGEICLSCGRKRSDCECKGKSHYYTACAAPLYYNDISKHSVLRIKDNRKFGGKHTLARLVCATIHDRFHDIGFDYLTIVPMSHSDKAKRGFNQSELLGKLIAKRLELEFKPNVLSKIYETKPQKVLKSYERAGNISGVFHISVPNDVKSKTILLFDDIITTGNTIDECAKMLMIYGAEAVYVCSVLLTPIKKRQDDSADKENIQNSV